MPAKSTTFRGIAVRTSGGNPCVCIRHDDNEIEIPVANEVELRKWLDDRLATLDETMVALLFVRAALEQGVTIAQVNKHIGKRATFDLSKDLLGTNSILRIV